MSYDFYSVNGEKILIKLSIDIGDILTLFKVYKPSFILEKCSGKKINKRKVNVEVANKNRKRR